MNSAMPTETAEVKIPEGAIPIDLSYAQRMRAVSTRRLANHQMLDRAFVRYEDSETALNTEQHELWSELYIVYGLDPSKHYALKYDDADGNAPHVIEAEPTRSRDLALEVGRRFLRCRAEGWKAAVDYGRAILRGHDAKKPENPYLADRVLDHTAYADGLKCGALWVGQGTEKPLTPTDAMLDTLTQSLKGSGGRIITREMDGIKRDADAGGEAPAAPERGG